MLIKFMRYGTNSESETNFFILISIKLKEIVQYFFSGFETKRSIVLYQVQEG